MVTYCTLILCIYHLFSPCWWSVIFRLLLIVLGSLLWMGDISSCCVKSMSSESRSTFTSIIHTDRLMSPLNSWSSVSSSCTLSDFHRRPSVELPQLEVALLLTPMWNIVNWWLPWLFPECIHRQHEIYAAQSHLHLDEKYATPMRKKNLSRLPHKYCESDADPLEHFVLVWYSH